MLGFYMVDWVLFKSSESEREIERGGGGRERQKWRMTYFGSEDQKQLWKFLS